MTLSNADIEILKKKYKILNPDIVKSNLMLASLYLTAYEMLRDSICGRIRDFFSDPTKTSEGWDFLPTKEYNGEVMDEDKDLIRASCLWLKKMNVISEEDINSIDAIREHRNKIAHELPKILTDKSRDVDATKFLKIRELLFKIDRWWIIEFEMTINEDVADLDVNPNEVFSMPMMMLDHLIKIVMKEMQ